MAKEKKEKRRYEFRRLEDLNVIDNFLFHQMLSDKEDGEEFARILLQTFLGKHIRNVKIVPQKTILGVDTDKHGIRLDAYIEEVPDELDPNLADARLPNVVIIMILPFDPFGRNRMVYTVKNLCVEDTSIPYEDGAVKIFLYTGGNADTTSQPLKDMLKYIQKSTDDNVTNQDIATIQQLATKVKRKKEVGINYMKSWEYEKWLQDKAFKNGYEDGKSDGFEEGFETGKSNGFTDGASNR